jgi:hypothetical protein
MITRFLLLLLLPISLCAQSRRMFFTTPPAVSSGAAWSPTALPQIALWFDAGTKAYKDLHLSLLGVRVWSTNVYNLIAAQFPSTPTITTITLGSLSTGNFKTQ